MVNDDQALSKYAAFFGRDIDFVRKPDGQSIPAISVVRFPAVSGLFRRFTTPMHNLNVYITCGMSNAEMHVSPEWASVYPSRIELIAHSKGVYTAGGNAEDAISVCLQLLALLPFEENIFLGPLQTASLEKPLFPGSEMSAFFFAVPGLNMPRLCNCTPRAELVVSVMPITSAERQLAVERGSESLLELFKRDAVPNEFDPFRKSVV